MPGAPGAERVRLGGLSKPPRPGLGPRSRRAEARHGAPDPVGRRRTRGPQGGLHAELGGVVLSAAPRVCQSTPLQGQQGRHAAPIATALSRAPRTANLTKTTFTPVQK